MLKPLGDRIVVNLDATEEVSSGGIIIPDSAQDKACRGVVIAVGKKVKEIKVKDRVFVGRWTGVEMTLNEKDCVLLREEDTLAIEV